MRKMASVMLATMLLLILFCGAATAEEARTTVTLVLGSNTLVEGNTPYEMDKRAYSRDLTMPVVEGAEVLKDSQTKAAVWYTCATEIEDDQIVIDLPYDEAWTTVEVNGELLSPGSGVQVELGSDIAIRLATAKERTVLHITFTEIIVEKLDPGLVYLQLGQATETSGNRAYRQDGREYERDLTVPLINGVEAIKYSQTNASVSYVCPCIPDEDGRVVIDFPYVSAWTTVEVNEELLSIDEPLVVKLGDDLTIRLASKNKRTVLHLRLSTLPMLVIDYHGADLYANNVPGTMTIYDPYFEQNGYDEMTYSSEITIGFRGQSSLSYDKHNYSIHLKDGEEQKKMSLLGLREDDDWILTGAMNDQIRLRNTVAMEIWDEFYTLPWTDESGTVEGEYCEVYMRGKYMGLFRLSERLDRKQLDIDKTHGRIVRSVQAKAGGVNLMAFDTLGKKLPETSVWYNMELKFPKEEDVRPSDWNEFYEFLRFVVESDDQQFAAGIGDYIDLDNFAAYYVYVTAIGSTGNMNKNLYFVMEDVRDEDAKFFLVPWDMDGSFGRRNDASKRPIDIISSNPIFERLITTNAQGFCDLLRQKWTELKDNVLSYDHMMGKFQAHYDALNACGMWEREAEAWPKFKAFTFDAAEELQYIYEYMLARAEFVEGYFAGDDLSAGDWLD